MYWNFLIIQNYHLRRRKQRKPWNYQTSHGEKGKNLGPKNPEKGSDKSKQKNIWDHGTISLGHIFNHREWFLSWFGGLWTTATKKSHASKQEKTWKLPWVKKCLTLFPNAASDGCPRINSWWVSSRICGGQPSEADSDKRGSKIFLKMVIECI